MDKFLSQRNKFSQKTKYFIAITSNKEKGKMRNVNGLSFLLTTMTQMPLIDNKEMNI